MKRYKLLKDLPNLKKGTILSEGEPIFGVKTLITTNNGVGTTFIGNELFEELFEEIQEGPTDSIHWRPKRGESYWFYSVDGNINFAVWCNSSTDIRRYEMGKVCRTHEECEKARDRQLAEARLRRTSKFKPGFENDKGGWIVVYNYRQHKLFAQYVNFEDAGEPVRYETEEEAKRSIEQYRKDWLAYFNVKDC